MKKLYNPYLKKSVSRNYIEFTDGRITFPLQDMIDVLTRWEGDFSDCSLLDIGCGTGNISNTEFVKRFKNYIGVEPSKEFFKYANKHNKNSNIEFYNYLAEDLSFEDESFDFMISIETWYYIKDINKLSYEEFDELKNIYECDIDKIESVLLDIRLKMDIKKQNNNTCIYNLCHG